MQHSTDTHTVPVLRYRSSPALWGIEVLNEPACRTTILAYFYEEAYKAIRSVNNDTYVVIAPNVYGQVGGT
jgi:hypothetical protein